MNKIIGVGKKLLDEKKLKRHINHMPCVDTVWISI